MLPILREELSTSLIFKSPGRFEQLVHPKSSFLAHIRYFVLEKPSAGCETAGSQQNMLLSFVAALPTNQLRYFQSEVELTKEVFESVLSAQASLQNIDVVLTSDVADSALLKPCLTKVKAVKVQIPSDPAKTGDAWRHYDALIHHAPQLSNLEMISAYDDDGFPDFEHVTLRSRDGSMKRLHLNRLFLEEMRLGDYFTNITDHIEVTQLVRLTMTDCRRIRPLLSELTACYKATTPAMRNLQLYLSSDQSERSDISRQDIEEFLLSFSGLRTLYLSLWSDQLVSRASVINHASTLEAFSVGTFEHESMRYSVTDLMAILDACKNLKQLGVQLGLQKIGPLEGLRRGTIRYRTPVSISEHVETEVEATLVRLCCSPSVQAV